MLQISEDCQLASSKVWNEAVKRRNGRSAGGREAELDLTLKREKARRRRAGHARRGALLPLSIAGQGRCFGSKKDVSSRGIRITT